MGKFEKQILLPALGEKGMVPGILRSFVKGTFDKAREVNSDSLEVAQIVPRVSIEGYSGLNDFGLTFGGFVKVNQDGVYDFSLTSDDGAVLYIGDLLVVDNDGSHEARTDRGMVALKAGFHPIIIKYHQFGTSAMLKAEVTDPDGRTHELSKGDLYNSRIFQTSNKKSIK
jgi:hexosaminidase